MSSANCLNLGQSKILSSGNGLNVDQLMGFVAKGVRIIAEKGQKDGYP